MSRRFILFHFLVPLLLGTVPLIAARHRPAHPRPFPAMERVLIPMTGETAEGGAYWIANLWARNDGSEPMEVFFPYVCELSVGCVDPTPFVLEPGDRFESQGVYGHVFLSLEKTKVASLAHTLRVENFAGVSDIFEQPFLGTELPLVPEDNFRSEIHLLNVPAEDGGLLKTLRIYALGIHDTSVNVEVSAIEADLSERVLSTQNLTLTDGRSVSGFDAVPSFASIDLSPIIDSVQSQIQFGRVSVRVRSVDPTVKIWAFIALLSPDTKQMTALTPGEKLLSDSQEP